MADDLSEFGRALASLVSKEIMAASRDRQRFSDVIERLAASLGLTIAMSAGGNGAMISEIIAGTEAYIMDEATRAARIAEAVAASMKGKRP